MQSYDDYQMIPRNSAKSSSTCVDKHPDYGQIGENDQKVVHYLCHVR